LCMTDKVFGSATRDSRKGDLDAGQALLEKIRNHYHLSNCKFYFSVAILKEWKLFRYGKKFSEMTEKTFPQASKKIKK